MVLRVWAPDFDLVTRVIVATGAVTAALSAVHNGAGALLEAVAVDRPATDGTQLRRAMQAHRALREHERSIGRRLTRAEMLDLHHDGRLPASALRDVIASVPPPSGG